MSPEQLHWTESNIESISVSGRELVVIASQVFALGSAEGPIKVKVTYSNVASARREVTEYIGDPKENPDFKEPLVFQDIEAVDLPSVKTYGIEGISTFSPIAWIDLEIQAQGATVELL
jgi:hypothetical protein